MRLARGQVDDKMAVMNHGAWEHSGETGDVPASEIQGWAIGAVASADALHAFGRGFESLIAHHLKQVAAAHSRSGSFDVHS